MCQFIFSFTVFLQETKTEKISCPGYTPYPNPARDTHHGQAILVRHGIEHEALDMTEWDMEDREVQALRVNVKGKKWVIINVYIGNDSTTKEEDWKFLSDFESLGEAVLIVGDFNARSSMWGNTSENPQGKALYNALLETDLTLLNTNEMTRFAQRQSEEDSNIDLAMVTAGEEIFTQWSVLPSHGSDHLPCSVLIAKGRTNIPNSTKKRPFN